MKTTQRIIMTACLLTFMGGIAGAAGLTRPVAKAVPAKAAPDKTDHLKMIETKFPAVMEGFKTFSVKCSLAGAAGAPADTGELAYAMPNKIFLVSKQEGQAVATLVSDGKHLTEWTQTQAATGDAPEDLAQVAPSMPVSGAAKLIWLIFMQPELLAHQPNLRDAGPVDLSGTPGRRLISDSDGASLMVVFSETFWLPVQVSIANATGVSTFDFTDFELDKPVDAGVFAAGPPATMKVGALPPLPDQTLLKAGTSAPDFTLSTLDGKKVTLSGLKGHVVMIDFWATWCEPCKMEMAQIQSVYKKLGPKGLIVLSVNTGDPREKMAAFLKDPTQYPWTFLFDPAAGTDQIMVSMYRSTMFPTLYLIDQSGKIVSARTGYDPRGEEHLLAQIAKLGVS